MTLTPQRTMRGTQPTGSVTALRARTTDPAAGVRLRFWLDDSDTALDMLDSLILTRFVDGSQPWARTQRLDRVRPEATLLPPDATPVRTATNSDAHGALAVGAGWTLRSVRWHRGGGEVTVTAVSDELATSVLAAAVADACPPPEPADPRVDIGFWYHTGQGAQRQSRLVAAQPWTEVRANYPAPVATAFDQLVTLEPATLPGRILLLHGPPGTGKTTALRSLAREWQSWCQLDFVVDPERLFAVPAYLAEVVIGGQDESRWRLLLLEDCDELIRPGAKHSTGQSLSRLLNLTDGLLGQGRQVLVAITTNEDIASLHPAVTRPGRCLGHIAVGRLSYAESVAWLEREENATDVVGRVPAGGATLAELLTLRNGVTPINATEPEPPTGLYL
jgi:hypothetical protein